MILSQSFNSDQISCLYQLPNPEEKTITAERKINDEKKKVIAKCPKKIWLFKESKKKEKKKEETIKCHNQCCSIVRQTCRIKDTRSWSKITIVGY